MTDSFATADLYDEHGENCASCETQFRQYGGRRVFGGRIRTVQCYGDNALVREILNGPGNGDVLVIDGGGLMVSALMGDLIAAAGQRNGWAGAVINGPVRDTAALAQMDFGVKALGSNPRKSAKAGAGRADVPVSFGGVVFTPGAWLYSDDDGILVAAEALV
ncbi:RraA family protein [Verticiella sediminum]|uniref:4-hydroxy-4-methyl-2-oxoglutarate aldolase n=1 Tax=Verticiella sediminum TaxID=1247510 RepID=A0A556AJ35_9BURK|nr:ribonuclease E activity regulator RraA [Verticiella sediminum]TSH92880.1 RraA family protein [Verticiella sediminum]